MDFLLTSAARRLTDVLSYWSWYVGLTRTKSNEQDRLSNDFGCLKDDAEGQSDAYALVLRPLHICGLSFTTQRQWKNQAVGSLAKLSLGNDDLHLGVMEPEGQSIFREKTLHQFSFMPASGI